jgi:putative PIN family toxin of toxin-antitoxin system
MRFVNASRDGGSAAPPRIVLDTNVLLDLWVFDDPDTRWLAALLATRRVVTLRTPASDAELDDVLSRARFELTPQRRQEILAAWQASAERVPDAPPASLHCTDPDDQKFLDLALHAQAALLLTKDRALLRLRRRARALGLLIERPDGAASAVRERLFVDQDMA